jgi:hypothetical protein
VFSREGACYSDLHHTQFPARRFSTGIAKVFRELPENKVQLPRCVHDELHATTDPPAVPERVFMLQAIARQLTKELEALNGQEVG